MVEKQRWNFDLFLLECAWLFYTGKTENLRRPCSAKANSLAGSGKQYTRHPAERVEGTGRDGSGYTAQETEAVFGLTDLHEGEPADWDPERLLAHRNSGRLAGKESKRHRGPGKFSGRDSQAPIPVLPRLPPLSWSLAIKKAKQRPVMVALILVLRRRSRWPIIWELYPGTWSPY